MDTDPHRNTLGYMLAKAPLNMLAVGLEKAKPEDFAAYLVMWNPKKKLSDSPSNVEAHALANMISATQPEAKAKTLWPNTTRCKGRGTARHVG